MKVAIVCDWLTGTGGAERVVLELHRLFPKAPIYTSQYNRSPATWYGGDWFKNADVRTTWLQNLNPRLKKYLPLLRAWAFGRLDLRKYDLVISSSGAEAKGIRTKRGALHINYCHAPTHYYWSRYQDYMKHPGFGAFDPLARLGLRILVKPLRRWDYKAAQRPHVMIANSTFTQSKIKEYYGRDSLIIHPPVDTERFRGPMPQERKGFVTAGRQTPYKRIDLPVAACTKLKVPLAVIGNGPDHEKLRRKAGSTITFLTQVSDENMKEDFKAAKAFIFPNVDDFGITAVEAMAAGTPVIAFNGGGARDYVIPGKTGIFFNRQTVTSLAMAIQDFDKLRFDNNQITKHAEKFSAAAFRANIVKCINAQLERKQKS